MDFGQIFVIGASWDKDELIRFGVKGQGHILVTDVSSTLKLFSLAMISM